MSSAIYFESELKHVTKSQIYDQIEDEEHSIKYIREKILMFCASNPQQVKVGEIEVMPIDYIYSEVSSLLDDLNDSCGRLRLLYQAKYAEKIEECI